jgi:hypothetical protein
MVYGRKPPIGYAAVYLAYRGFRNPYIDTQLKKALGFAATAPLPNLELEDAVRIMEQGRYTPPPP